MEPVKELGQDPELLLSNYAARHDSKDKLLLRPWEAREYKV